METAYDNSALERVRKIHDSVAISGNNTQHFDMHILDTYIAT